MNSPFDWVRPDHRLLGTVRRVASLATVTRVGGRAVPRSHTLDLRAWAVRPRSDRVFSTGADSNRRRQRGLTPHGATRFEPPDGSASRRGSPLALLTVAACGGDEPGDRTGTTPSRSRRRRRHRRHRTPRCRCRGINSNPLQPASFGMHVLQIDEDGWPDVPIGVVPDLERRLDLGRARAFARSLELRPPRPARRPGRGSRRPRPARAVPPAGVGSNPARPPGLPGLAVPADVATRHWQTYVRTVVAALRRAASRRTRSGTSRTLPSSTPARHNGSVSSPTSPRRRSGRPTRTRWSCRPGSPRGPRDRQPFFDEYVARDEPRPASTWSGSTSTRTHPIRAGVDGGAGRGVPDRCADDGGFRRQADVEHRDRIRQQTPASSSPATPPRR